MSLSIHVFFGAVGMQAGGAAAQTDGAAAALIVVIPGCSTMKRALFGSIHRAYAKLFITILLLHNAE